MGATASVADPFSSVEQQEEDQCQFRHSDDVSFQVVRPSIVNVPCYYKHPFQHYKFGKKLGEGAFSTVFKGTNATNPGQVVAIKEIDMTKLSKQQIADLGKEMCILSQVRHTSIVGLYAVYQVNDKKYLIMDYLRGGELLNAVCQRETYTEGDVRRIMLQLTSALSYLHARGVMHRDVRPENIILESRYLDSPIKLVDFGFATTEEGVNCNYICGKSGYMAPEIIKDRQYSTKVDVWSLGVLLYLLLSGTMPFAPPVEQNSINGTYSFPTNRWHMVSESAKDLVMRMLIVNPAHRLTAREALKHEWMMLPLSRADCFSETGTQRDSMNSAASSRNLDCHEDVDISANLISMRELNAIRKLNLTSLMFTGTLKIRRNSNSSAGGNSLIATPLTKVEEEAELARQEKKLDRLVKAIVGTDAPPTARSDR